MVVELSLLNEDGTSIFHEMGLTSIDCITDSIRIGSCKLQRIAGPSKISNMLIEKKINSKIQFLRKQKGFGRFLTRK